MQPKLELKGEFGEGKDVEFEMSLEVLPEIGQLDFSGIELERLKAVVPEKDVDEAWQRIAKANREQKLVDPPRPAQKGDALKLDFVGSVDGVEFDGGKAEDYVLELGSGSFIPGFEDQLIGAEVGTPVEVKVKFPDDYGNKELAGKDAVFKCTVKEIQEFVRSRPTMSSPRRTTSRTSRRCARRCRAHRPGLRSGLAHDGEAPAARQARRRHKFEVPEGLVEGEFNAIWQRVEEPRRPARSSTTTKRR
jgi:trigger factor